ncbi:MAG TPA: N-methyl-L-tryptophan oxidase [Actinomycetota bacterium]|nr:N-methyl-L-tryptophan oxidase [Actinomycetota bacterium]
MTKRRDFRYVVVGLGGIGSAAVYALARRAGSDVLGIEQFAIGHDRGASQDHSRIIRHSYHSPLYVSLTVAAYEEWRELERALGRDLLVVTGGLDLWPPAAAIPMADYTKSLTGCGIPFELLDAGQITGRWPQFELGRDVVGLWQEDAGIAPAARCNAAHIDLARRNGAILREHSPVSSITERGGEILVEAGDATFACEKLVLTADAWTNELLAHLDLRLPLTVTQEQVTFWATPRPERFAPGRFPVWIWMDDPSFYGFPVYGERGVKAGQDVGGREVTARTRTFEVDEAALERLSTWMQEHLPTALGPVLYTKTCLYTMPPDRDFVIGPAPGRANIFIGLGAAHGYKFASLIGKILMQLACDGTTPYPIEAFSCERPVLTQRDPEKSFLV